MTKQTIPATSPAPMAPADQLEAALRSLIGVHQELLTLAAAQRRAISEADARGLADISLAQGQLIVRVTELERERQLAVAAMLRLAPSRDPRPTIAGLARSLAEPVRARLMALADMLRDLLNRLHAEHTAVRAAAESLSSHMEGMMRQLCRKLAHAGTYARSGIMETGSPVVTAIDVRS